MKKYLIPVVMTTLLSACSTTPTTQVTRYLLTPVATTETAMAKGRIKDGRQTKPVIVLAPVNLDSLLQNQGIIYQTDPIEVVIAQNHVWAEDLSTQISNRLLANLRQQQTRYQIIRSASQISTPATTLLVSFNRFNGSYQGNAVIAGEWTMVNSEGELLQSQLFHYQEPLADDGYTALVNALSTATNQLTQDLGQALQ